MVQKDNDIFSEEHSTITIREHLSKYLAKWPLFLASVLLCIGAGYFYTRYTTPKYIATSYILIKGAESGSIGSSDLIESALNGKREVNLNNEMMLMNASSLMERTVAKNGFNVTYYRQGRLLNTEIYNDAPFRMVPKDLTDTTRTYRIFIESIDMNGGVFLYGPDKTKLTYRFQWGMPFKIDGQSFVMLTNTRLDKDGGFLVQWQPIKAAAADLKNNLTVNAFDSKTDVVQLSIKTENLSKGKDLLNALYTEFNFSNIEDRNKLSESTIQFIDDRLLKVSGELKGVEGNLESYQGSNQLVDIKNQSTQSLENANNVYKTIKDLGIQQSIVTMILNYFANPINGSKLVPSSLGLNDPTLASLITQYNEVELKREREAPSVAPNSTVMLDLNAQVGSLKSSILESLTNISKNLRLQEGSFEQQNSLYHNFLSAIPHNERVLQEIKRKQSITEGLYMYLLQKREEAAIASTASNIQHYRQIDPATGFGPVEPNVRNIYVYSGILGFFLAFGLLYITNLFNDKVATREDVLSRTIIPLLGQVSHISKRRMQMIPVLHRSVIGEQFRTIRTNLTFSLTKRAKKVILVTSSMAGEGKSFISLNLAAVYAMPGKKVAWLEFDIRRPAIANSLELINRTGITDYLAGQVNSIVEIKNVFPEIPTLHVYPAGSVPYNPADLLLSENMIQLFEILKEKYDYIIVDSAPAGLVTDAFILGEYSDIVLYIIRSQKTSKKQIDYLNEKAGSKALQNVTLLLNDVKKKDDYGYGYGYEREYNYGKLNGSEKGKKASI